MKYEKLNIDIAVENLTKSIRLLHLTDTHITNSSRLDDPYAGYARRMDAAYAENRHYQTGEVVTAQQCFTAALALATDSAVDLIALTGDIVNNPSAASVLWVKKALVKTGIDHLYTAGNHDWHFEGIEGSDNEQRERWRSAELLPLYPTDTAKESPGAYSVGFHGMQFVAIDNSTYQVDETQVSFFRAAVNAGQPIVLLLHIPISVADLPNLACGHPEWGAASDKNYMIERRQRWPESGNSDSTKDFVQVVAEAPNLVAVLSGHLHISRADTLSPQLYPGLSHPTAKQYITRAGAHGGGAFFTFVSSAREKSGP